MEVKSTKQTIHIYQIKMVSSISIAHVDGYYKENTSSFRFLLLL